MSSSRNRGENEMSGSFSTSSSVSQHRDGVDSITTSSTGIFAKSKIAESYLPTKRQCVKIFIIFLYFMVGCIFYHYNEGWSVNTSISFTIVTMATVGYGYHHPTNDNSRIFTMFYLIFGVYFVFVGIAQALTKRMEKAVSYISTVTDANNLFANYNYHKRMMGYNIAAIIICIIVGGFFLTMLEDWSFVEGIYFALETSSTVGYGDLDINNERTHLFLGGYIIFSTVLLSFAFNNFQMLRAQKKQLDKIEKTKLRAKDLHFLVGMDKGNGLTEEQFVLAILKHLGTINYETDVEPWLMKFREMKPDNSGKVYRETLSDFSVRESMQVDHLTTDASVSTSTPTFSFSSFAGIPYYPQKKEISKTTQKEMVTRSSNLTREDINASLVQNQYSIA